MMIGESAKHLDLDYILSRVQVHTPYGEVEKKNIRLFTPEETDVLQEELDRVEKAVGLLGTHRYVIIEIRNQFKRVRDLTGTFSRLSNKEVLSVTELFELKTLTDVFAKLATLLQSLPWRMPASLSVEAFPALEQLFDPERTGTGTFYIYDAYSEGLKGIRGEIRTFETKILAERKSLKERVEAAMGLRLRPNGEITVPKTDKEQLLQLEAVEELVYSSETYINTTFKLRSTPGMDAAEAHIELLKGKEEEEEYAVRSDLSQKLSGWLEAMTQNTGSIGRLDLLLAKAALATGFQAVKPVIRTDGGFAVEEGRHMKVANHLARENKPYTPISLGITQGVTCITGANMGGKTVTLRLVGMLTAMAQMGFFVPADSLSFTPRRFYFISVGDEQNADQGLSTFGAEMLHIGEILKEADREGLILIDELARGTNPREGYAISMAIMNYLKKMPSQTLITTHFDGLADADDIKHLQVMGLSEVDFDALRDQLTHGNRIGIDAVHELMNYRLREVHGPEAVPKDAINISRLMGLDEAILEDARNILNQRGRH